MSYFLYRGCPVEVISVDPVALRRPYTNNCGNCSHHFAILVTGLAECAMISFMPNAGMECVATVCGDCAEKAKAAIGVPYLQAMKEALAEL